VKPPENAEDYRQCVACEYISSDERLYDPYTLFPCPSCKRKGIWSKDVDWSSPDRALDELAAISQELGLE
jgi:predicted RNA-binding Zn-ribbon protein involved in translation (DUF1610 family)